MLGIRVIFLVIYLCLLWQGHIPIRLTSALLPSLASNSFLLPPPQFSCWIFPSVNRQRDLPECCSWSILVWHTSVGSNKRAASSVFLHLPPGAHRYSTSSQHGIWSRSRRTTTSRRRSNALTTFSKWNWLTPKWSVVKSWTAPLGFNKASNNMNVDLASVSASGASSLTAKGNDDVGHTRG